MIENYLLEQFVEFVRCGTLSKASESLHISQPSLTRSMRKLEEEFGVSLFHRENSKISLNETGKLAYDYAVRALQANQEMIDHVTAFDKSINTISIGTCSPFPANELLPLIQERFIGKTISTETENEESLINDLKKHRYDLVITHVLPDDKSLFCQKYLQEQLYISISENHPLSERKSLTFNDIKGLPVLMSGSVGFWKEMCLEHLDPSDLLIQTNPDALDELVDASTLPVFNSDQMLKQGYEVPGRISLPISDEEAHVTYYLVCLKSEKEKFESLFNAVRANLIKQLHIIEP